jgi:hypothetical protein
LTKQDDRGHVGTVSATYGDSPVDWRWWAKGEASVGAIIHEMRELIDRDNHDRQLDLVAMRAIYKDDPCGRFESLAFHRSRRSRYNLIQGAVDATHAGIVASRPRPRVITIGQDHSAQQKAILRQRWLDGEYARLGIYEKLSEMVLDALIYGDGCLKVSPEHGRNVVDRVWKGDLWVDALEERHHRVRTLYQLHSIDRDELMAQYPDHAEAIEAMPGMDFTNDELMDIFESSERTSPHRIGVVEAWRLPISKDYPGRHVIVAHDRLIHDEEWTHKEFPFVFFGWAPDPQRWWSQGMVERGAGMQSDINELTETIQKSYRLMVPQLYIDAVVKAQADFDNEVGRINWVNTGGGDIRTAVMVISPDVGTGLTGRERDLADRFLPVLGVDMLGARAEKPAGLNSGIAIQEYHDKTSQRFLPAGRRYENTTVTMADLLLHFAGKHAEAGNDEAIEAYGQELGLELIRYADIKEEGDEIYRVQVKPGSMLPKDPAGRIQMVFDMQALGLDLDPPRILEILEMPDTEALAERILAGRRVVQQAIDRCGLDPEDEPQPQANAYWPRAFALSEITTSIQLAEYRGAGQETIERMNNLHGQLRGLPDPNAPPPLGAMPGALDPNALPGPLPGAAVPPGPPPPAGPPPGMPMQ